jgi:hypothetical protein
MSSRAIRSLQSLINDTKAKLDDAKAEYDRLQADVEALERSLQLMIERNDEDEETAVPAKQIRNEMVTILQNEGAPLHYGEIYNRLVQRGIPVPGKEPRRNVGAHLSNDERFEKQGSGNWGLASWQGVSPGPKNVVSWRDKVRDVPRPQPPAYTYQADRDEPVDDNEHDPTEEELREIEFGEMVAHDRFSDEASNGTPF